MSSRRKFVRRALGGLLGVSAFPSVFASAPPSPKGGPAVVSTWKNVAANSKAWQVVAGGGSALDAVEQGVMVAESDPKDLSVGYGGRPDRDGRVTLDACVMEHSGNCGAVCFLEDIEHPVSVARKVMEHTPHVMLAGSGAQRFALEQGFEKKDLLTENARKAWKEWKKKEKYQPIINIENHDTIGMLAIDQSGQMAGACTTSGLAFKINGRVGDSPIIGAGLYLDGEVGGAVATGLGEAVMKSCGSFLIVELMRQGWSPEAACREALSRIVKKQKGYRSFQVGFLALRADGEGGAYSLHSGFSYMLNHTGEGGNQASKSWL